MAETDLDKTRLPTHPENIQITITLIRCSNSFLEYLTVAQLIKYQISNLVSLVILMTRKHTNIIVGKAAFSYGKKRSITIKTHKNTRVFRIISYSFLPESK